MNHLFTCVIAGSKGGVGKTTTSINLGASLAAAGCATVTVELDLAMANFVDFLEVDIDVSESATIHDVLADDRDIEAATYETESGLSIIPSGTKLQGYAETEIDRLPEIVETLRRKYDVVLLDTPAGLTEETVKALQVADETILVSTPRVASVRNVRNTKKLAERVDCDIRGLLLTKSGTGASPGAERVAEFLDVELLGHVPEDEAVPHSQDKGQPVISNAPNSAAATAYRKAARQLVAANKTEGDSTEQSSPSEITPHQRSGHRDDSRATSGASHSEGSTDGEPVADAETPSSGKSTSQEQINREQTNRARQESDADRSSGHRTETAEPSGADETEETEPDSSDESIVSATDAEPATAGEPDGDAAAERGAKSDDEVVAEKETAGESAAEADTEAESAAEPDAGAQSDSQAGETSVTSRILSVFRG